MKISQALIAFCIGLFMTGFSYADNTYKSTTVFKRDFQNQDWNGVKITVGTLKGVNKTFGSSIANIPNGESVQNCLIRATSEGSSIDFSFFLIIE